jgi:hypothetical protein
MRNATCCLLVVLFGSWSSSLGQNAPKFTTPQIVATFERLGLTAELPPTTIYTPKDWGTFRISIVMVGTVANGQVNPYWEGGLQFTDGAGLNRPSFQTFAAELATDIRRTAAAEFPIRAKAGKPLKFSVTSHQGDTSGTKYNVWIVVEQLM